MDQAFLNNEIYKYLNEKENNELLSIINTTYKHCEDILGEIPKEFSNYTLHNIHHAIRVINYMTEFVRPNIKEFSDFHLALILLVGLLHDTGMFVSDEEKKEILDTKISKKTDNQQEAFQDYIRERHSKRVRNIIDNYIIDKDTDCKFSSVFRLDSYNFTDDIAAICQSHTESLDWIKDNLRTSKNITKYPYSPQHIALLLKLGDNLDIDARRAPYSLLKLLEIKGFSKTEWEKHSPISNYEKIRDLGDYKFQIWFDGKCDNPFIYRKVRDHILWLQNTCIEINKLTNKYNKPYCLNLDEEIDIAIETVGFEATNLQFTIDYSSMLNLLMGEQIYGKKKSGLRELIQNSIDAIMVMQEKLSDNTTSNYQPTIWIEMNREKNTISVCDNGTGMSPYVLENYFFNIGKSYYNSNDYRRLNLNYSAIGRFGIGFLACFMLSSNVLLETQKSGQKPIVIEFERTSQFVTKLKNPTSTFTEGHGTRIHLSYDEVFPNVFSSEEELIKYVKQLLLVDGYTVKINDSKNKTLEINSSVISTKRHIRTERFDINYTLSKQAPMFLYDFTQISNIPLFIYCDENDLSIPGMDPIVVDLTKSCDVVHQLFKLSNEPLSNQFDKRFCAFNIEDPSIRIFLSAMIRENDTEAKLQQRISRFVFEHSRSKASYFDCMFFNYIDSESQDYPARKSLGLLNGNNNKGELGIGYLLNTNPAQFAKLFPSNMLGLTRYAQYNLPVYILSVDNSDAHLPISEMVYLRNLEMYMHGIHVDDSDLLFKYIPTNFAFENCVINIKSDEYKLDISRDKFDSLSNVNLKVEISKEIFKDLLQYMPYNDGEKQLISLFIEMISNYQ